MRIKDISKALYAAGVAALTGETIIAIGGVDPSNNYKQIHVDANGSIISTAVLSPGVQPITYCTAFSLVCPVGHSIEILPGTTKDINILQIWIDNPTISASITIAKQSIADTGGTSSNATLVPMVTADGAATATIKMYTVAPSAGTLIGNLFYDPMTYISKVNFLAGQNGGKPLNLAKNSTESAFVSLGAISTITAMIWHTEV